LGMTVFYQRGGHVARTLMIFINAINWLKTRGRVDTGLRQPWGQAVMVQRSNDPCCQPELYNAR
jgi:hypothetical protein